MNFNLTGAPYRPGLAIKFGPSVDFGILAAVTSLTTTAWSRPVTESAAVNARFSAASTLNSSSSIRHAKAGRINQTLVLAWGDAIAINIDAWSRWGTPLSILRSTVGLHNSAIPAGNTAVIHRGGTAIASDDKTASSYNPKPGAVDSNTNGDWFSVNQFPAQTLKTSYALPGFGSVNFNLVDDSLPSQNFSLGAITPAAIRPTDQSNSILVTQGTRLNQDDVFPWGPAGYRDYSTWVEYPDYNGPIDTGNGPAQPEIKETYIIMNTVNAVKLPERTPISILNIGIDLDVDSWAWSISGDVIGDAAIAQLNPVNGVPAEIEIELNGHKWIGMVESYGQSRQFANNRFSINCVSRTQMLAAPYAPKRSKVFTADINAKQAAQAELTNTGFTLNWDTTLVPDWNIPAGAFSYQNKTPIEVITRIAEAVGAVVIPSPDADEITIQPRLKVSPWSLAAANAADVIVPLELVTNVGMSMTQGQVCDTILVSGVTHGAINTITRDGKPGTSPSADVVDELITDEVAATERARQEIGQSGRYATYSLTLPIPESGNLPGIVLPGQVADEQVAGVSDWKGYVLSTRISAPGSGSAVLNQTIEVLRLYDH